MNESNCTRCKTLTPEQTCKSPRFIAFCPMMHHDDNGFNKESAQEAGKGLLPVMTQITEVTHRELSEISGEEGAANC